jgi:hypothetical protein
MKETALKRSHSRHSENCESLGQAFGGQGGLSEWGGGGDILTRGSWVRIAVKARRGICEQDTLKSTARGSHNKQNCLRHP